MSFIPNQIWVIAVSGRISKRASIVCLMIIATLGLLVDLFAQCAFELLGPRLSCAAPGRRLVYTLFQCGAYFWKYKFLYLLFV